MIEKNNTWELVDIHPDRKVIGVKWVFRTKLNVDGSINRHKTKLVGYFGSDWGGSLDDMKSTSGYYFTLDLGIFSWCSKKQEIVA